MELGAISADHLEQTDDDDMRRSGGIERHCHAAAWRSVPSGPERYAPARNMIEAGVAVALATDFNPGTSPTYNMQMILALACSQMRMTPAEAFAAATVNGAHALGCADRAGSIEAGKDADLVIFNVPDYREIPYHFGVNLVEITIKRGEVLFRNGTSNGRETDRVCAELFRGARCREDERLVDAVRSAPGIILLDQEIDADHNRWS